MKNDILLEEFFKKERWDHALEVGVGKGISKTELRKLCSPETRKQLLVVIATDNYVIAPPHQQLIPKDTPGEFRTVYINENIDRIFLSIVNDMLFELFSDMVHPTCKSYQKGIGCGKVVQEISREIQKGEGTVGWKSDLSKYFDSVPLKYIDEIFDEIERKIGKSKIIDIVRYYYHCNVCFTPEGNLIEHYQSLKQGCAVASFLADALLYDMDDKLSKMKGKYVRYSDDCLYIGKDYNEALNIMKEMLQKKELKINPKKLEYVDGKRYVKFLGFALRCGKITLSKNRVKKFQKEIERLTIKNPNVNYKSALHAVLYFLYGGKYSWASSILPIINVEEDIDELNKFVMDCLRAVKTGKKKVGGLGYVSEGKVSVISRGTGKNVKANREKVVHLDGYKSIREMRNAYMSSHEVYECLCRMLDVA